MANNVQNMDDFVRRIAQRTQRTFQDAKVEGRMPPLISRKKDRFWLVSDGNKVPAPDPLALDFVVISVKKPLARFYYDGPYDEEVSSAPACYSLDSVTPESDATSKQCDSCAGCPKAEWGSAASKKTGEPVAACRVEKQMAIQVCGVPGVWMFSVPPSSIKKQWGAYADKIEHAAREEEAKNGYATLTLSTCVTRATFDEKSQGVLNFAPRGYIGNPKLFTPAECEALEKALDDAAGTARVIWGPSGLEREKQYVEASGYKPKALNAPAPARVIEAEPEVVQEDDLPFQPDACRAKPEATKPRAKREPVKKPVDQPAIMTDAADPASVQSLLEGLGIGDL